MIGLSDDEIEDIFKGIYSGKINSENLPQDLYASIAEKLKEGVYKGFGGSLKEVQSSFGYGSASAELLQDLRENIYLFAGAKTFQQTEEMRGFLEKDGKVLTYSEFQTKAKQTFERYNETWMQAEYNTAIGQAESARKWRDIEENKGLFPLLRYNAVIDSHTSEICRPFDDLVLPVDHPFWKEFSPLNHYLCRCTIEQMEAGDAKISAGELIKRASAHGNNEISDAFKMNPGQTGEVFSKEHPYFKDIPKQYKELAKDNFNLPIPETSPKYKPTEELKKWGVEMDDRIFSLLTEKTDFNVSKKGAYASATKSELFINVGSERWKGSEYYRTRVIYHETAHVIHRQKGIIKFGFDVAPEYSKHFTGLKKMVDNPSAVDNKLLNIYRNFMAGTETEKAAILEKYACKTEKDLTELITSTSDSLMSLTNGRYGYGHTKKYFKIKGAKEAELFAHSAENFFQGNTVFEEVMPEVYEATKKYFGGLLND